MSEFYTEKYCDNFMIKRYGFYQQSDHTAISSTNNNKLINAEVRKAMLLLTLSIVNSNLVRWTDLYKNPLYLCELRCPGARRSRVFVEFLSCCR